ncbi:MAG: hypothetical protein IJ587_11400 [Synergistaceae bacterium]|nr:hypothetical protein [Synergistaceae bacterium]
MDRKKIDHLLELAWTSASKSKQLSLTRQVLDIDPDNTEALIILADNTDDNDEREKILLHARETLGEPDNYQPDMKEEFAFAVTYRLAYTYFAQENYSQTLLECDNAEELLASSDDPDGQEDIDEIKSLRYRTLIAVGEWQKILALTMKDETRNLSWAYSRLIAVWIMSGGTNKTLCASMFWDALILSPDVPFYMLGYYEEPDDDEENEAFDFAVMYYDILSVSDEFFHWFTRGTILFGLLTNRFDGREREYVLDVIDSLGGYEEYECMSGIMLEADDRAVIETLATNKCLSK